jgi:hypothetical protein
MKHENTIVAFRMGRDGIFDTEDTLTYLGEHKIIALLPEGAALRHPNEDVSKYANRFGFDEAPVGECILDLISAGDYSALKEKFGIFYEDLGGRRYYGADGRDLGLTEAEAALGLGSLDYGNNTIIYTRHLVDCTKNEIRAILAVDGQDSSEIALYVRQWKSELVASGYWPAQLG